MDARNGSRERDRVSAMAARAAERQDDLRERWVASVAWLGALAVALVAAAALVAGCGRSSTHTAAAVSTSPGVTVVPASNLGPTEPAALPAPSGVPKVKSTHATNVVAPDIAVAVADTLVLPGQAIEVTVEGTPDVTEMALWDGLGEKLPMVCDSTGLWRVNYRVPLRPKQERLALSVTAKSENEHWRRVWLFLHVQAPRPDAAPDAGEDPEQ